MQGLYLSYEQARFNACVRQAEGRAPHATPRYDEETGKNFTEYGTAKQVRLVRRALSRVLSSAELA